MKKFECCIVGDRKDVYILEFEIGKRWDSEREADFVVISMIFGSGEYGLVEGRRQYYLIKASHINKPWWK